MYVQVVISVRWWCIRLTAAPTLCCYTSRCLFEEELSSLFMYSALFLEVILRHNYAD